MLVMSGKMTSKLNPPRNFSILVLGVAILLCATPIASQSLWWEVCRGRAVCDGVWDSSAQLIQLEQLPDSDALAGSLPWLAFDLFGASGLMFLKLVVVLALVRLFTRHCRSASDLIIAIGVLMACVPAFDPDHRLFDLLGIVVAWNLAAAQRLRLLSLVVVAWCNYSMGAVWCIPVSWLAISSGSQPGRRLLTTILLVTCALCINFRGPMAIVEMFRFAVPFAFDDSNLLARSGYGFATLNLPALYSVCLCLSGILHPAGSPLTRATLLVCGLVSACNGRVLPLTAMIAGLTLMSLNRRSEALRPGRLPELPRVLSYVFSAVASVSVLVLMAGGIYGHSERLGWGIADGLDHRLIDRDVGRYAESRLLAHCSNTNAAGLLLLTLPKAEVVDVAEVAIKRGRLEDFAMLNYDLSTGRKKAYARSDGTMGGWWNSLINGKVDLLVISAQHTQIFAALEPTLWKPLALDSPVIVLGQAGSRLFTRQIIDVRDQRDLVDFGPWKHQLLRTTGNGSHTDLWQMSTGLIDSRSDIRQAAVFRSMGILNAAARTILPVVSERCRPDGIGELIRIQQQLSWMEKLHCGRHSQWRLAVLSFLGGTSGQESGKSLIETTAAEAPSAVEFPAEAVRLYCRGQPQLAAKSITQQDAESLFAIHSLYWQAGDQQQADRILEKMQAHYATHPLTLAVEWERGIQQ